MKSKWMKCCAVLMGVLLATSPLTALAEEPQEPTVTAVDADAEIQKDETEAEKSEAEKEQEELKQKKTAAEVKKSEENHSETVKEVKAADLEQKKESTENGEAAEQSEEDPDDSWKPTVATTFEVNGKTYDVKTDSWKEMRGDIMFIPDYTDFKYELTEENYPALVIQFVKKIYEKAKNGGMTQERYTLYCNKGENEAKVIPNLRITIDEETYRMISELKETYGKTFRVYMNVSWGKARTDFYCLNIEKPTVLGFEQYDCLDNTNVYFYGDGYDGYTIDGIDYKQGGSPVMVQAESGKVIGVFETSADESQEEYFTYEPEYQFVSFRMKITQPGLYYIMPKASADDNSRAKLSLKSNGDVEKVTTAISGAVATAGDKATVKIDITETKDSNGTVINPQIGKAVFEQLNNKKAADAAVTFSYGDLSYKFAAADITNPGAVESITLGADEATSEVKAKVGDNVAYAIDFAHSGKLPGKATVTIPVDLADGQYTWCYVNDANQLTEGKLVTVKNKTVEVPLEHCSTYALVAGDVTGTTNGNTNNGNSGNTNNGNSNNDNTNSGNTNNGSTDSSNDIGNTSTGSSSGSHGNSKITRVDDNSPAVNSVKEVTGTEVLSHTTYWALSDYYRDLLVKQIDKAKAPGEVLWFYDITVDEVTFPLTFTVNVKGLNGRKATVVHFLDDETPEYITPTVKGDQVTFTLNSLSPVAIVADGTKAAALTSPKTGDSTDFTAPLALLLLAAAGLTGCAVYSRRKKQA